MATKTVVGAAVPAESSSEQRQLWIKAGGALPSSPWSPPITRMAGGYTQAFPTFGKLLRDGESTENNGLRLACFVSPVYHLDHLKIKLSSANRMMPLFFCYIKSTLTPVLDI